jgi:ADP-ribose pyrophosphatase
MKRIFEGEHVIVVSRDGWEYVERKSAVEAVAVIAVTEAHELVLTEQHRAPVNARVIDLPAGLVGDEGSEDAESAARKELEEETGFRAQTLELLARGPTSPGITSEIVSLYRARGLSRIGEGGGVGAEKIGVHLVSMQGIEAWLEDAERRGVQIDLKVQAALRFVK